MTPTEALAKALTYYTGENWVAEEASKYGEFDAEKLLSALRDLGYVLVKERKCIFTGCVSTDRHWHGGFPGGYDNPADPDGVPIPFTTEPAPGVRDYNGALLTEPKP